MNRFRFPVWPVIALLVCASGFAAAGQVAGRQTKATVRAVHVECQYKIGSGEYKKLRPNDELPADTTVKTGTNSSIDLIVNGRTSTVRLGENTTLALQQMEAVGPVSNAFSHTTLDLKNGTIIGSVRTLPTGSSYKIITPVGFATIQGGDFMVSSVLGPDGTITVTFKCVTGTVECSVTAGGKVETKVLAPGESWSPGPLPPDTTH